MFQIGVMRKLPGGYFVADCGASGLKDQDRAPRLVATLLSFAGEIA
jgi:hypothetical protein